MTAKLKEHMVILELKEYTNGHSRIREHTNGHSGIKGIH